MSKKETTAKHVEKTTTVAKNDDHIVDPSTDPAVLASKGELSSENSKSQDFADNKESKDKVKEHEEFVKDVEDGKVSVNAQSPADLSTATAPLVADPLSSEPKYATADQWFKAEQAKGNL